MVRRSDKLFGRTGSPGLNIPRLLLHVQGCQERQKRKAHASQRGEAPCPAIEPDLSGDGGGFSGQNRLVERCRITLFFAERDAEKISFDVDDGEGEATTCNRCYQARMANDEAEQAQRTVPDLKKVAAIYDQHVGECGDNHRVYPEKHGCLRIEIRQYAVQAIARGQDGPRLHAALTELNVCQEESLLMQSHTVSGTAPGSYHQKLVKA